MTVQDAFNLALKHHQSGRVSAAETIYRQILAQSPRHADAQHMLGVVAHQTGRHEAALELVSGAIAAQPDTPIYYCNLGLILAALGRWNEAIAAYQKSLAREPRLHEAHYNLAVALKEQGRWDEAIVHFKEAIRLRPDSAFAHNGLGNALSAQGAGDAAIECFGRALALRPNYSDALNNLGQAFFSTGRMDQAIECFNRALALQPESPGYLANLANALHKSGHTNDALAAYKKALDLSPQFPLAHWNLGLLYLILGDFENGWREFEWRWRVAELDLPRVNLPRSAWDGGDLGGRRILLHAEQGFGDAIQFIRYVPTVVERGGKIVLACQEELLSLLGGVAGIEAAAAIGQPMPEFEVYCSLLTLPGIFATTLDTIPAKVPYLFADESRAAKWRSQLAGENRLKVGLAWNGRLTPDPLRSIPPAALAPLAEVAGIRIVSLQMGTAGKESLPPRLEMTDWTDQINDFADTAALIANLDLVITIDTAVAHLAGAMGKATWVLLKYVPDWRWLLRRGDSPWYPTMKLFRQPSPGDWDEVIRRVATALRETYGQ